MFDDKFFEQWLESQSQRVMQKVTEGHGIVSEELMILLLKAQTNHFAHLDQDLRNEMLELRKDQTNHFTQLDQDLRKEMIELRTDMDKRFEQVEKRLEQVDKRLEQADKRFEQIDKRFEQVDKRFELVQEELKKMYQAINTQTWKMIGAISLIVILARLAGGISLTS
jgi:tetrahydromethanopterin S-methyltransferase subunit G